MDGIKTQFSTGVGIRLSQVSIDIWGSFEEEFGVDIESRRADYLYVAREKSTADLFRETIPFQNDHGVPSEFLISEEAHEHVLELDVNRYVGTAYCPTDGVADPHLGHQGFSMAAGVDVHIGVEVADVLEDGVRVVGVDTTKGRYEADYVVNAAGSWSPKVAEMRGSTSWSCRNVARRWWSIRSSRRPTLPPRHRP